MRFLALAYFFAEVEGFNYGGLSEFGRWGLLSAVLGWLLLKHLPDKDKQTATIIEKHDITEERQRQTHSALEREQRAEFQAALDKILDTCKSMLTDIVKQLGPPPVR